MEIDEISMSKLCNDSQEVLESESEAEKSNRGIELDELLTGLKNTFSSPDRYEPGKNVL